MLIVEVGLELEEKIEYYDKILKSNGLENDFNCITHDIYFTNKNLDELTENEMKCACIRLRSVNRSDYKVQNNLGVINDDIISRKKFSEFEKRMLKEGYKKIFDTKKKDHHYYKKGMTSKVQLQEIDNIGLLVYFDNKQYYDYDLNKQRKMLIDELNRYGFSFDYDTLGLDKLRTLYYGEKKFSQNQNG